MWWQPRMAAHTPPFLTLTIRSKTSIFQTWHTPCEMYFQGMHNKYFTGHHHKVQIWVQTWIPVSATHLDYQWWKWADTIWRQRRAKCKKLIVIEAQFNVFTGYSYQYLPNCISNYMDSKPIGNNLLCTGETSFHIVINLFLWNVLTNIKAELLCSVR